MKHSTLLWAMVVSQVFGSAYAESAMAKRIESTVAPTKEKTQAAKDLWVVSQKTDLGNQYNICISKDAIKFASGKFVLIAKEPDWQASLLNQRAKLFWTMPLDEFQGLPKIAKYNVKKLSPVTTKSEPPEPKIAAQPVTVSEGDCQFSEDEIKAIGFAPSKIRICTSSKVPVSGGELQVLGKIVGVEGLEGIPLEVKVPKKNGKMLDCLQTQWCLNRELDKQSFDIPKAFTKGKSLNDVETQNNIVTFRSQVKRHQVPTHKNPH